MRTFILYRVTDVSGISGTGVVAEGVEFSDGVCVCRWITSTATTTVYDNIQDVESIHGHDGATRIIFENDLLPAKMTATDLYEENGYSD